MKRFWKYFIGAILLTGIGMTYATYANDTIVLSKSNTLAFHDVFTDSSVTDLQAKALKVSSQLPKNQPIYLFLDTPGGSVVAGESMLAMLKNLPQEVKTITNFAASMGFVTVESLGERLILQKGVLMAHRAQIGVEGQIPGEVNTRLDFWSNYITDIETNVSKRMGLSLTDYRGLTHNEYWVSGAQAVKGKAADRVVDVRCGADLSGTYDETLMTFFGPVKLTWSECPLITAPVAISFSNLDEDSFGARDEVSHMKHAIYSVYGNRDSYINDSIVQSEFTKYVR